MNLWVRFKPCNLQGWNRDIDIKNNLWTQCGKERVGRIDKVGYVYIYIYIYIHTTKCKIGS